MKKNRQQAGFLALTLATMLLVGCSSENEPKERHGLEGVWALQKIVSLADTTHQYHVALYRIYDEDGMMYEYQLPHEDEENMLISGEMKRYTCIDKGGGEYLYIEDNKLYPMEMTDDTTMVTQQFGMLYKWIHTNKMSDSSIDAIKRIVSQDHSDMGMQTKHLLPMEKPSYSLYIIYIVILAVIVLAASYVWTKKMKRRVQQKMQQLDEERTKLQEESEKWLKVNTAKTEQSEAEQAFMASAYYISLRNQINANKHLHATDWEEMERQINKLYPDFAAKLQNLCNLSETEWQICMLIKLHLTPSEMSKAMKMEPSSISSVRKRLFKKIFNKEGKPKDWDDFILSL